MTSRSMPPATFRIVQGALERYLRQEQPVRVCAPEDRGSVKRSDLVKAGAAWCAMNAPESGVDSAREQWANTFNTIMTASLKGIICGSDYDLTLSNFDKKGVYNLCWNTRGAGLVVGPLTGKALIDDLQRQVDVQKVDLQLVHDQVASYAMLSYAAFLNLL